MPQNDIRIPKQLCKFCIRVLKNETHNIHAEEARQRKREKSLNELTNDEIVKLSVCDEYFADKHIFNVLDREIVVMGNELAAAISKLPQNKRDVILLSFFCRNDRQGNRQRAGSNTTNNLQKTAQLTFTVKKTFGRGGF